MKVYNQPVEMQLHPQLLQALIELRTKRNFQAETWLQQKQCMLNNYMSTHSLSACVVALSGGLDSAMVLALVNNAACQEDSPIKNIIAVALPCQGTSNQEVATARAKQVAEKIEIDLHVVDASMVAASIQQEVDLALVVKGGDWATGQLAAYARTPILYYITSLLSQQGTPGVICGTTNRDEGAYLGYVGKASDGMVDLQLIADLHKAEVKETARCLGVPEDIVGATPTGDMYDERSDEQVFGAPYDFVQLYLQWRCLSSEQRGQMLEDYGEMAKKQWQSMVDNLERLHAHNAHKYLVGSPAVHLNIMESAVPGGWQ